MDYADDLVDLKNFDCFKSPKTQTFDDGKSFFLKPIYQIVREIHPNPRNPGSIWLLK
jgi:hypothetical protein